MLGDQNESNAWVIHGKHTETGLPLLASDPHLKNNMPCDWTPSELRWGDNYLSGATLVGMPGIANGRTKDFAWGITTTRVDSSDLWQEEVNDDFTQYKVDGEWRPIRKVREEIKVKFSETIDFEIGYTHRGPMLKLSLLKSGAE